MTLRSFITGSTRSNLGYKCPVTTGTSNEDLNAIQTKKSTCGEFPGRHDLIAYSGYQENLRMGKAKPRNHVTDPPPLHAQLPVTTHPIGGEVNTPPQNCDVVGYRPVNGTELFRYAFTSTLVLNISGNGSDRTQTFC